MQLEGEAVCEDPGGKNGRPPNALTCQQPCSMVAGNQKVRLRDIRQVEEVRVVGIVARVLARDGPLWI